MKKLCKKCEKLVKKRDKKMMIFCLIVIFVAIQSLFIPVHLNTYERINKFFDRITDINFNSISRNWETDQTVKDIANLCGSFDDEFIQVKCVYQIVNLNYNYSIHEKMFSNTILQPEEILNKGGVCRDYAILYDSVFNLLGFKTEFVLKPEHVYNKVCKNKCYIIDMDYLNEL